MVLDLQCIPGHKQGNSTGTTVHMMACQQTFAKREALQQLYGHNTKAGVLMALYVPEIQKETLALLRQTHQTEAQDLDQATEFLDEKETPQRHEVARLIKHFVHHGHLPHNLESNLK